MARKLCDTKRAIMVQPTPMLPGRARCCAISLLCLSVVLLSLNAKLSLYDNLQQRANSATNGTNLLVTDQKMEVRAMSSFIPVLWLAAVLSPTLRAHRTQHELAAFGIPVTGALSGFEPHQFLRPPPSF